MHENPVSACMSCYFISAGRNKRILGKMLTSFTTYVQSVTLIMCGKIPLSDFNTCTIQVVVCYMRVPDC